MIYLRSGGEAGSLLDHKEIADDAIADKQPLACDVKVAVFLSHVAASYVGASHVLHIVEQYGRELCGNLLQIDSFTGAQACE